MALCSMLSQRLPRRSSKRPARRPPMELSGGEPLDFLSDAPVRWQSSPSDDIDA